MKQGHLLTQGKVWRVSWTLVFATVIGLGLSAGIASAICNNDDEFTGEFRVQDCHFKTVGENPYFLLNPGYQLVLAADAERVAITVLAEKQAIHLDGRTIMTRVVEERESEGGIVFEISRNFFAICAETNDVFYFGEDVGVCDEDRGGFAEGNDGQCADGDDPDNPGEWRAGLVPEGGVDEAQPGVIMPGGLLLGSKYFQEVAFPVAADRGENTRMGLAFNENNFDFQGCVEVVDTNSVDNTCNRNQGDAKVYCPGVGLVIDEELKLVEIN